MAGDGDGVGGENGVAGEESEDHGWNCVVETDLRERESDAQLGDKIEPVWSSG